MEKAELMFIPCPGVGHLVSAMELAKLLINQDEHLSAVFLILQLSFDAGVEAYLESQSKDPVSRIRFVKIPKSVPGLKPESKSKTRAVVAFETINTFKPAVRDVIQGRMMMSHPDSPKTAGIVVDMFCAGMIDVANEFRLPSYVCFASGAAFLGLQLHVQTLYDDHNQDVADYKDSDVEILVGCYTKPVPAKVLPTIMLDKDGGSTTIFTIARKIRETNGIIINTFQELESHAIKSLSDDHQKGKIPPIYPIGPMINWNFRPDDEIMKFLDAQPSGSVVFLCFGTFGSFGLDQVKEIASALERSGCRFLWSLRQPPAKGSISAPAAYANHDEILPEGFSERTSGIGKVVGWAPQMAVLSHPSVGGFVSHCGWNSILESLWAGVPMAAWPMYAEQQVNAFQMVVDLGVCVEIKMDYRHDANMESQIIVSAEEIQSGIERIMMEKSEIGEKVKKVRDDCRKAVLENGSSYVSLGNLLQNIKSNINCVGI